MSYLDEIFGVAGKTVLVTGGGRGIGESIAEGFVKSGARVYICSRKAETCEETAGRLSQFGTCIALPVTGDIATEAGRTAIVAAMQAREEKLDILINNAGALWAAPLAEYPESGWDKVFDLNVKGLFFLIRDLVPLLEAAGTRADPSRIINIGSIDGFHIPKHETYAYSSSKAASHQLSIHLADQLASRNITVNVIAPGMFPSKMMQGTLDRVGEEKMVEKVPLRRLTGPDDMAGTAIYLASRAASYVTGAVVPVDGGRPQRSDRNGRAGRQGTGAGRSPFSCGRLSLVGGVGFGRPSSLVPAYPAWPRARQRKWRAPVRERATWARSLGGGAPPGPSS